ncbi:hypothetical protein [Aminivibrio sp.]|uniref:hypothetical protein n=1 Tax=Aminivibrio sp. TaxID=1872489 RepID=UPI001A3D42AD|nr:hypothetical protein [Aminivibrio sp.]MBL3540098.1 hypothetical protein [Aminivibrio sp.]
MACSANIGSALTLIGNPQDMLIGQYLGLPFGGYLVFAALADRPFAALSPGHRPRALPGKISSSQGGEGGAGTALQRMADGEGKNPSSGRWYSFFSSPPFIGISWLPPGSTG